MRDESKENLFNEGYEVKSKTTLEKRGSGWVVFFLITTFLFLGISVYLLSDNMQRGKTAETLTTKVTESESRYTDLDSKYTATLAEIESYKGKNAELDAMLSEKQKNIESLQASLNKERKHGQLSEADYKKHLDELDVVISDLNTKVDALQKENVTLTTQRDSLGKDVQVKQTAITDLTSTNTILTKKVTIASLLIPQDIVVAGSRFKSNGKELVTYKADKVQQIKMCFKVPENQVADVGQKVFMIRLINPKGQVLSVEDQGSGQFSAAATNEIMQYTTSATIDYASQPKDVCVHWTQKVPFDEGKYTTEIYQDGYLVGKQAFEMK